MKNDRCTDRFRYSGLSVCTRLNKKYLVYEEVFTLVNDDLWRIE